MSGRTITTHGSANSYKAGCRCEDCRRANTVEHKRWQLGYTGRLVDPTGTRRRIHALVALGWTLAEIAEACGRERPRKEWTGEVLNSVRVHSATAAAVRSAYDLMSMTRPEGPYRNRQRIMAERKGYAPPLAWDDDTIDDPDARPAGIPTPTRKEPSELLVEDWEMLRRNGYSRRAAAEYMGITKKRLEKAIIRVANRLQEAS